MVRLQTVIFIYLDTNYTPACHHPYQSPPWRKSRAKGFPCHHNLPSLESQVEATTTSLCLPPHPLCLPPTPPSLKMRAVGSLPPQDHHAPPTLWRGSLPTTLSLPPSLEMRAEEIF